MPYVMGVDGGGSKTYTVISNEKGDRVSTGLSGCGNHQSVGIKQAITNISESIESALMDAGLSKKDIAFVQFGLAGADRPMDFSILEPAVKGLGFDKWDIVCDTMEGLRTGSSNFTGVVLVCGAGTNCAGRNKEGKIIQTGGFGYLYGDWAGGYHIAQETFRAAVRSWEYREEKSILVEEIPAFLGYNSMEELVNDFLDRGVTQAPIELTELLHKTAEKKDKLSISILEKVGKELGLAVLSVIRKLGDLENDIPIVLTGSILQKGRSPYLLDSLENTVKEKLESYHLVIPTMEPVYGSVLLAMDSLDINITNEIYNKFESYGGYR